MRESVLIIVFTVFLYAVGSTATALVGLFYAIGSTAMVLHDIIYPVVN